MGKEDQLNAAKRAYRSAKEVGNRQEEARWANVVGDILKNRGEYVEALRWLRIDYDVSVKHLPEKQVLPTCQSIGEVYLRLQSFKEALVYQKKHLELARDAGDLIEQQRASTQLGRTYHEMFLNSSDDHYSIRNAKKYFKLAMKLARTLKDNPPDSRSSFVKEYIDAHNNIGMLEIDLDNFEEAKEILTGGLEICDEEEVDENDDGRTRLHHNLGCVYIELREWRKAQEHIEKDIRICMTIGHRQGEAKGYINLGELHYRIQKYEDAIRCYKKALDLAKSMEDEDALATQINQNINIVKEAKKVMDELKKEEQKFKKLTRDMAAARGTAHERQCLLRQIASLDSLIDKSSTIFAWPKHLEFAKQKKRVASELGDKERLSDSFLTLGESYEKLRHFKKAIKWFKKSWEICKSIGNLEGQAVAKINIGDVLDSIGDWTEALNAFEEGYRMAIKANLPSVQLSALENMHYSHMIRFDNLEEAQRLQHEIDNLRTLKSKELESKDFEGDCCSETNTEEDNCLSESRSNASSLKEVRKSTSVRSKSLAGVNELSDDVPLVSLIRSRKYSPKRKGAHSKKHSSSDSLEASPNGLSESVANKQTVLGRKRGRLIISDDEGEMNDEMDWSREGFHQSQPNECPVSDESKRKKHIDSSANKFEDSAKVASKFATSSCNPINVEESSCSYKSLSPKMATPTSREMRSLSTNEVRLSSGLATSGSKSDIAVSRSHMRSHRSALHVKLDNLDDDNKGSITFRIDNDLIEVDAGAFLAIDELSLESIKVELSCLYYLQLPSEKRSKGLMPIIQHMTCGGRVLESLETVEPLKGHQGNIHVEVTIKGWVQKRLMKLYIDCCEELSETPNVKLLKKLYISEVEDEVIASECELQDISITPLLKALHAHKTVAMLNLSHNFLGNATMEKLQEFFSSSQKYGDLTLDLHHNRFGPTALFQICECPVLFARLEVLNMSGNRLTDACGSYLSTILENCTALYSLNIERCSITSRTIQKVADALNPGSVLSQLCIGFNSPISGNAMIKLLDKLATLKSFLELNLNGIKLTNPVVDSLCELAKTSCLSRLILGSTGIGTDGAKQLTEAVLSGTHESMTLDLSYCGITPTYIHKLNNDDTLLSGILELNLGGNPSLKEAKDALAAMLMNSACSLKVLVINKCELGLSGIIQIIQALAGLYKNECLEELHLADNTDVSKKHKPQDHSTAKGTSDTLQPEFDASESSSKMCSVKEADNDKQLICSVNTECNQLEVADSEDDPMKVNVSPYELDDTCTSSYQKNSSFKSQFIQELSTAIGLATQLQFLDLSNNYFSAQEAEALYDAWSSRSGTDSTWKHIKDKTVHFSTKTNKCCCIKPCCRRD